MSTHYDEQAGTNVPTLQDAFMKLCNALQAHYEDNTPAYIELAAIGRWHILGLHVPAWRRAIALLEGALGSPARGET